MVYKGIKLTEFKSDKPIVFDPPKEMLVWDFGNETPFTAVVMAYIPARFYSVISEHYRHFHCAEIPNKENNHEI